MERSADDFPSVVAWAPVAAVVEGDLRSVVGLDHSLEVREVDVVRPQPRMVETAKAARQSALAAAFGQEDPAHVRAVDAVGLLVRELDQVEGLEPHRAASRSTYLASTSTSRFNSSPGSSEPSVVAASVCRTSATANESSVRAVIVSETPSTVIEPFSTQ